MISKIDLTDYFVRVWIINDSNFIDGLSKDEVIKLAKEHVDCIEIDINDNRTTS